LRYSFHAEQWVPYNAEEVFAFFANPSNLPALMPQWQKARIEESRLVAPPAPPGSQSNAAQLNQENLAGAGSEMTISFRPVPLSPIRITWLARIVEFHWFEYFCDEQPRGPFRYWHHCHRIERSIRAGVDGSILKDDLEYELPFGVLGDLAQRIAVGRQIKAIFAYRQKRLPQLLGSGQASTDKYPTI
jgi:ligand-binding SRPBCC domain-containing protein